MKYVSKYLDLQIIVLKLKKYLWVVFSHLELWVAVVGHNFNGLKIKIKFYLAGSWLNDVNSSSSNWKDSCLLWMIEKHTRSSLYVADITNFVVNLMLFLQAMKDMLYEAVEQAPSTEGITCYSAE